MAANFDAILKITTKVAGEENVGSLTQKITSLNRVATDTKTIFKGIISSAAWQAAAVGAAAVTAALGLSVKAAIDFEDSVAQVAKVMEGLDSPQALQEIKREMVELSRVMPITARGFADIYAAAGAAGIPRGEVKAFAQDVAKVSIAFDMTAADAGVALAKIRSGLGLTQPEVRNLADAINYLSNTTASEANQIVDFMRRAGVAGQTIGLAAKYTAAFGAAMIAAGGETDMAATSFITLAKSLSRGDSMTERQIASLQRLGLASGQAATEITNAQQEIARAAEDRNYINALERRKDEAIRVAEKETDAVIEEARRRMDRQMDILDEQLEGEQKQISRRYRNILTQERRRTDDMISELQRRYTADDDITKNFVKNQTRLIEDQSQSRVDTIDDQKDKELDSLRKKTEETKGIYKQEYDAFSTIEKAKLDKKRATQQQWLEEAKAQYEADAKLMRMQVDEDARQAGVSAGLALSRALQENSLGTIMDIFARIKALPKELQLPTITDLFGDEARTMIPVIQNMDVLKQSLAAVSNEQNYLNSVTNEYEKRLATTKQQMQLFQNNLNAVQIAAGSELLPAINNLVKALNPLLSLVGDFAAAHPTITLLAIAFVGFGAALLIALPGIVAAVGLFAVVGAKIALIVAAVVALPPIFLAAVVLVKKYIVDNLVKVIDLVIKGISSFLTQFPKDVKETVSMTWKWLSGQFTALADGIKSAFMAIPNAIRSAINAALSWAAGAVNGVIGLVNGLIEGVNRVASAVRLPTMPLVPTVPVPQFATGAYVTGPTRAVVGEGGEPEYVIPASRMAAASTAYIQGSRGAAVVNGQAPAGGGSRPPVVVNLTGPTLNAEGRQWVTAEAAEAIANRVADDLWQAIASPAGRMALGGA